MKKRIIIASALVVLLSSAFMLRQLWPLPVEQTLPACVYENGNVIEYTSVTVSGTIKKRLLSSEQTQTYVGILEIACLEKSCREGAEAKIVWYSHDCQLMNWYYMGDFYTSESFLDISKIEIDEQMKDIRVFLSDGRLIHASALTENISTNSGV